MTTRDPLFRVEQFNQDGSAGRIEFLFGEVGEDCPQCPRLSCPEPNVLALGNAHLRLEGGRSITSPGDLTIGAGGALTVGGRNITTDGQSWDTHLAAADNPHKVTAAQVGALALSGGTLAGALTVKGDLTITGTGKINGRNIAADGSKLDTHLAATNNPHKVNAAQAGALPLSGGTLAGALTVKGDLTVTGAGTINGRNVATDGSKLDAHVAATSNPHKVNASQVGALALSGGTLTGALTVQGDLTITGTGTINGRNVAADGAKLDAHLAATNNPHKVTAAQIGALALSGGTLSGALTVKGDLTTTGTVTINGRNVAADGSKLDTHLAATDNPHKVTAAQVGALAVGGGTLSGSLTVTEMLGANKGLMVGAKQVIDPEGKWVGDTPILGGFAPITPSDRLVFVGGVVTLDDLGRASVPLQGYHPPSWWRSHTQDHSPQDVAGETGERLSPDSNLQIQLTPLDGPAPELFATLPFHFGAGFDIAGGPPNLQVSWQATWISSSSIHLPDPP